MKILMITPFFHPHLGGVEKHVKNVSKHLLNFGNQVEILTSKYDSKLSDVETIEGIKVIRFPNVSNPKLGFFRLFVWILLNRNYFERADVIHFHDIFFKQVKLLFPTKHLFITFHGYEGYPKYKEAIKSRKWVETQVLGNICVGDYISKWYRTKPDFVTYGGVDLIKDRENKNLEFDAAFIGRLEPDTGILDYLQATKKLNSKTPFHVVVVGDGSLKKKLELFVKENGLPVKFTGFIKDPKKFLFKSKIAFVSGYLSIIEAMVSKKLVIAYYDNPLKKDYLGLMPNAKNNLIRCRNVTEIVNNVEKYSRYKEAANKKINSAYNWAKNQTWSNVTAFYVELYQKKGKNFEN